MHEFRKCVTKYHGNYNVKTFSCLDQFLTLSFLYIPVFTPSRLPEDDLLSSLIPSIPIFLFGPFAGMVMGTEIQRIRTPVSTLEKSGQVALKGSASFLGYDFSLSYYRGRYSLSIYDQIDLTRDTAVTNINTSAVFPRVQVAGFDFAGSLGSMGV